MIHYLVLVVCIGLIGGLVLCVEVGFRIGKRLRASDKEKIDGSFGVVAGALLGLLGLILGFSFAGAQARMDTRRQFLVQEANAIGTAYLRVNLLLPPDQEPLRQLLREYTDTRILVREHTTTYLLNDPASVKSAELQKHIWDTAVRACEAKKDPPTTGLLLPALNEMIDLTTSQDIARKTHLPVTVLSLLVVLSMLSGLLVGHSMSAAPRRNWLLSISYAIAVTLTAYVILDLELPRIGLIRLDYVDDAMRELREGMK